MHLKMASPEALHLVILWACETEEGSEVLHHLKLETHVLHRMILHVCICLYMFVLCYAYITYI